MRRHEDGQDRNRRDYRRKSSSSSSRSNRHSYSRNRERRPQRSDKYRRNDKYSRDRSDSRSRSRDHSRKQEWRMTNKDNRQQKRVGNDYNYERKKDENKSYYPNQYERSSEIKLKVPYEKKKYDYRDNKESRDQRDYKERDYKDNRDNRDRRDEQRTRQKKKSISRSISSKSRSRSPPVIDNFKKNEPNNKFKPYFPPPPPQKLYQKPSYQAPKQQSNRQIYLKPKEDKKLTIYTEQSYYPNSNQHFYMPKNFNQHQKVQDKRQLSQMQSESESFVVLKRKRPQDDSFLQKKESEKGQTEKLYKGSVPQKKRQTKFESLVFQEKQNLLYELPKPNILIAYTFKNMESYKAQTLNPKLLSVLRASAQNIDSLKEKELLAALQEDNKEIEITNSKISNETSLSTSTEATFLWNMSETTQQQIELKLKLDQLRRMSMGLSEMTRKMKIID